jgi:tetratricopeptide (TPR) repeat protein
MKTETDDVEESLEQQDKIIAEQVDLEEKATEFEGAEPEPAMKKQRNWWWIIAGVVLVCVCLAVSLNALKLIQEGRTPNPTDAAATNLSPSLQRTLTARTPPVGAIGPVEHLQTAEALVDAGENREALNELLLAGDMFLDDELYVQAAKTFQRAADALGGPLTAGFRIQDALTQALFMGAIESEMYQVISQMETDYPAWEPIRAVRARYMLHQGNMQVAVDLVETILLSTAEDPYALAVKAEWLIERQEYVMAEDIIKQLLQRTLQPWFIDHLSVLLREIETISLSLPFEWVRKGEWRGWILI